MITGSFLDATIAAAGTISGEVNLGRPYERVLIKIPTIDSAQVGLLVAEVTNGDLEIFLEDGDVLLTENGVTLLHEQGVRPFIPLHYYNPEDAISSQWLTTSGTGGLEAVCESVGGFQFIKVTTSAAQNTGAVTFRVCGIRS